jgi:hypothetical protein
MVIGMFCEKRVLLNFDLVAIDKWVAKGISEEFEGSAFISLEDSHFVVGGFSPCVGLHSGP